MESEDLNSSPRVSLNLPITPPATVEKQEPLNEQQQQLAPPRKLLSDLKKASRSRRKPRSKYRPPLNSVFNADEYVSEARPSADDERNAQFIHYTFTYSKRIIIVAGAGVSVAAGIPDFRSSSGLFSSLKGNKVSSGKELFDFNRVYADDSISVKFNKMIVNLHQMSSQFKPTSFHCMVNELAREGSLRRLYTQNIDCLEDKLPHIASRTPLETPTPVTVRLHGSINHMSCTKCSKIYDLDPTIFKCDESQTDGHIIPLCPQCQEFEAVRSIAGIRSQGVGKLRPRIVLYNEYHPEGDRIGDIATRDLKSRPDCLVIVGTSLKIPGVRTMCRDFARKVHSSKGVVLWINSEFPSQSIRDFVEFIDLIIVGDCQNVPEIVNRKK